MTVSQPLSFLFSRSGLGLENLHFLSSQVILMLLVLGPHLENHRPLAYSPNSLYGIQGSFLRAPIVHLQQHLLAFSHTHSLSCLEGHSRAWQTLHDSVIFFFFLIHCLRTIWLLRYSSMNTFFSGRYFFYLSSLKR